MTLGDSIHRTNNIYFSAYDANVNTQIKLTIRSVIGSCSDWKTQSRKYRNFRANQVPNIHDDEKEEEAAEKKDGVEASTGATATGGADSDASPEVKSKKNDCKQPR